MNRPFFLSVEMFFWMWILSSWQVCAVMVQCIGNQSKTEIFYILFNPMLSWYSRQNNLSFCFNKTRLLILIPLNMILGWSLCALLERVSHCLGIRLLYWKQIYSVLELNFDKLRVSHGFTGVRNHFRITDYDPMTVFNVSVYCVLCRCGTNLVIWFHFLT
jgi:predicted membrane protein